MNNGKNPSCDCAMISDTKEPGMADLEYTLTNDILFKMLFVK